MKFVIYAYIIKGPVRERQNTRFSFFNCFSLLSWCSCLQKQLLTHLCMLSKGGQMGGSGNMLKGVFLVWVGLGWPVNNLLSAFNIYINSESVDYDYKSSIVAVVILDPLTVWPVPFLANSFYSTSLTRLR